ncbi:MAG: tetratricopeptide repeat protein [Bryobacterales bacterium]|nr:tetratricopeptide repeat protein [Bryobacterales bacterium]
MSLVREIVLVAIVAGLAGALASPLQADPAVHLQRSVKAMQQGDLEGAEAEASRALHDPATKPVAQALLGSVRLQQNRHVEGVRLLESAVELNPNLVGARLNLAQAYAFLGKSSHAEAMLRDVLRLAPDNPVAGVELARIESGRGNHRQALELARPVETQLRKSPDGLTLLASSYAALGDRDAVRGLLQDWRSTPDVTLAATIRLALSISQAGMNLEAAGILERLKREGFSSYEVAFNLAGFYLLENDLAKASENYELAVKLNDRSVAALRQVARIAEQQGELEKALSFLIRAKLEAPNDPEVLLSFGTAALRLELIEDATKALQTALERRPTHRATRYWLATARGAAGQYDEALKLYQGLLAEHPEDAQLHFAVGSVFYLKIAFEDAARHLEESLRLDPDQLLSPYYLAMVKQKQGRNEESIRMFRVILESHPVHALSYEGLAVSLFKERQYEESRLNFEKAIELDPTSARANYQLGQLLVRMGLRDEARQQLAVAKDLREEEEKTQLVRTLLNPH